MNSTSQIENQSKVPKAARNVRRTRGAAKRLISKHVTSCRTHKVLMPTCGFRTNSAADDTSTHYGCSQRTIYLALWNVLRI